MKRVRDTIHGLISFDLNQEVDRLAWAILDSPELQRLRRIRQLGVSEFVFPGATHTRFAHSLGVFHNAKKLMAIVEREEGAGLLKRRRAVALIAALVHDVGHGPFSHAFEVARERIARSRGVEAIEKHEAFSAKMIRNPDGGIFKALSGSEFENIADEIADLIKADDPVDIYHAVVSSSFDADRLDYLVRDRHMTGVESGAIDEDWLLDNLQKYEIAEPQDDDEPRMVSTFVFRLKGRQAAEDFLLARYRLYSQLYLHKTTRGFEQLIGAILFHIAENCASPGDIGLNDQNKFVIFFRPGGETLDSYASLDDGTFWSTVKRLSEFGDQRAQLLSKRLLSRDRLRVLDVSAALGHSPVSLANAERRLDEGLKDKLGVTVFKDTAPNHLYGRVGGESAKAHKMVRVINGAGEDKEITEFPDTIISPWLTKKKNLVRYYFLDDHDRDEAERMMRGA